MKCKYWKKASCSVDQMDRNFPKYWRVHVDCPKGVDKNCNVVKNDIVVKGWAHSHLYTGMMVFTYKSTVVETVPCTIHIKAADYARLKGKP